MKLKINRTWTLLIKWVCTIPLVVAMAFAPTYYATRPMQSNYAWIWCILVLYAVWTKRDRTVIRILATIGVGLAFIGGVLGVLNTSLSTFAVLVFSGLIAYLILLSAGIWLKYPTKADTLKYETDLVTAGPTSQTQAAATNVSSESTQSNDLSQRQATGEQKMCNRCGSFWGPEYRFCPKCGKQLRFEACPYCHFQFAQSFAFCPNCGKQV